MADVTAVRPATIAAFLLAMVIALPVAQSVYDIPVQHGDVLEPMILGATAPSTAQLFARSLHVATNTLRPLRFVQSRWLLQLSEATGASYHAVFRGVHALLAVVLVLLFVHAAGVRSWLDVAAVSIPLTVLLGMPTLVAVLGEAYPVNHFIEIAIFTLAVLPMAVRPRGWWTQAAAVLMLAYALLLLESGVLVWVAMVSCLLVGLPGLARRTVTVATVVLVAYVVVRFAIGLSAPAIGDHGSGYGTHFYSGSDLLEKFGARSIWFRVYNVVGALLGVLFSEPRRGVYQTAAIRPVFIINVLSSALTTSLIGWYLLRRLPRTRAAWTSHDRVMVVSVVLVVVNSLFASTYIKDEILSVAGVFYAVAAYIAIASLLRTCITYGAVAFAAAAITIVVVGPLWTFRVAGLHFQLKTAAFKTRNEWATARPPAERDDATNDPTARAITRRLRSEAVARPVTNVHFLPHWGERYWVE